MIQDHNGTCLACGQSGPWCHCDDVELIESGVLSQASPAEASQPQPSSAAIDTVDLVLRLPKHQVHRLLRMALEFGSRRWCRPGGCTYAPGFRRPTGEPLDPLHVTTPLLPGGGVMLTELDEAGHEIGLHELTLPKIVDGLLAMLREAPHHFAEILATTPTYPTADLFLQCCLFGRPKHSYWWPPSRHAEAATVKFHAQPTAAETAPAARASDEPPSPRQAGGHR